MNNQTHPIAEIALPCPLRTVFDYQLTSPAKIGMRVLVPFGRRQLVGVIVKLKSSSKLPEKKLKPIEALLDDSPLIDQELLKLCLWATDYYQYPIGEVFAAAMPKRLRENRAANISSETYYSLSDTGKALETNELTRVPAQAKLVTLLKDCRYSKPQLIEQGISRATLNKALEKTWIIEQQQAILPNINTTPETPPTLNSEQQLAVQSITNNINQFAAFLLYGITGSGKTEVYFQAMQSVLSAGKQVLVLIPEISLTPQTITRFKKRFAHAIVALHSGLNDTERSDAWLLAKSNQAKIIIGTRSAIFTPAPALGMIIIDEEHDSSFKQQEGFRYHARDLALIRAHQLSIPVVLGSATPSLESWHNAECDKYQLLLLTKRAGKSALPTFKIVNTKNQHADNGLAAETINTIKEHLEKDQQVLVFLNRRGYAPVLICQSCEWVSECNRCDSKMVLHHQYQLHCHHCGKQQRKPQTCPHCASPSLLAVGQGTQRLEETLNDIFAHYDIIRVDRDSIKNKTGLDKLLATIHQGGAKLLIGTQMLAKGHHFPNVTLAVILDIDSGFLSADFRAPERTGQLIMQVAGRSGRADKPGTVILQTRQPDHPMLAPLIAGDYSAFAEMLLTERRISELPPFSYLALLRAEAKQTRAALQFLEEVKTLVASHCQCLGPIPAPMQKKAGFFHAQLVIQDSSRKRIQSTINNLLKNIEKLPSKKSVKWSIDIDPIDLST